ncbi:GNAT family N-acetyltransferase [Nocardioides sp. NBC_00368]|uniref:GNAT family N-acetyltransferase n=1 Tax=Nocardioides sp. NBC_00368 TaxID=2976000 RepID=UPI002E1ECC8E
MEQTSASVPADVTRRPDGRTYLSIDAWASDVFVTTAREAVSRLPRPAFTLVDEEDADGLSLWESVGFAEHRREAVFVITPQPSPPSGVTVEPFGATDPDRLTTLYDRVRDEVDAELGWHRMPTELVDPRTSLDASHYAVATRNGQDVGLVRVTGRDRQPRIGLVAVLRSERRRGVGTALIAFALDALYRRGVDSAIAEVDEGNNPALGLASRFEAMRRGGLVELVCR